MRNSTNKLATAFGAVLLATVAIGPANSAELGIKVGILTCDVQGGWGYILGSAKEMVCEYRPTEGPRGEYYTGSIARVGVDLGYSGPGVLVWNVIAPASDHTEPGTLEGAYGGATAGAAIGVGGTASLLVGGLDKSITLQPLSIEGHTGLNLAAGIAAMNLTHSPS